MFLKRFSVNKKESPKEVPNPLSIESAMKSNDNVDACHLSKTVNTDVNELKVVRNQCFGDILIFGTLCEASCKSSIPISILTLSSSLVDQLIKEAFKLHANNLKNYEFNLERTNALLNESPSDISTPILKSLVLLGKSKKDKSVACKAILQVSRSKISIVCEDSIEDSINVPTLIIKTETDPKLNYIYNALVWILLAKEGFYLDSDGYFNRLTPPSTYNLTPKSFYNHTIFDPYLTLEIFTDKQ